MRIHVIVRQQQYVRTLQEERTGISVTTLYLVRSFFFFFFLFLRGVGKNKMYKF